MFKPYLTITCDCGEVGHVHFGEAWTCEKCGRTWDTAKVPREEYDAVIRSVRRYSLLTIGPPALMAAILVPAAVLVNISYAFLLFVLVMGWGLLVAPQIRRRARRRVFEALPTWKLKPE